MIKFNDTAVSIVESTELLVNGSFLHTRALGFNCGRLVGVKAALDDASDAICFDKLITDWIDHI